MSLFNFYCTGKESTLSKHAANQVRSHKVQVRPPSHASLRAAIVENVRYQVLYTARFREPFQHVRDIFPDHCSGPFLKDECFRASYHQLFLKNASLIEVSRICTICIFTFSRACLSCRAYFYVFDLGEYQTRSGRAIYYL